MVSLRSCELGVACAWPWKDHLPFPVTAQEGEAWGGLPDRPERRPRLSHSGRPGAQPCRARAGVCPVYLNSRAQPEPTCCPPAPQGKNPCL